MRTLKSLLIFLSACCVIIACKKTSTPSPSAPTVHAGSSQTVQMPVTSFTLTGSASVSNGTIQSYHWSVVTGPNVPTINNAGQSSTTISNIVTGHYVFQLIAVTNSGLTGSDTTGVTVEPPPIQTLSLQPTNNPNEVHVLGNNTGINNGDALSPDFVCAAWTTGGQLMASRSIVKFDLSSIPVTATILTAKLTLYSNPTPLNGDLVHANYGTDNSMFIQRVTSSWIAASTQWLNQPTTTTTDQVSIPHTPLSSLDLIDIDVKNMVAAMVSTNNYGFLIRLQTEVAYNDRDFSSSKYSTASKHPMLVVTYQ